MIPIYEPFLKGNEGKYIRKCLDTNWISSQGDYVIRFESELAGYHGMNHAIVTSSGTTALHLSLKALGIGLGDEVICPSLTFVAPANMILLSGADIVLTDVHPETLTIDPAQVEEKITEKTKSILVVHQFGHAAHMDEIMGISTRHNIKVIEDNAESIGAQYKGRLLGTIGDIATLSFFANKIITSGEGGAILTNDEQIAVKCRELRDHGMSLRKKYYHVDIGYNYRMTNLQAAIGLAQVEQLDSILRIRKRQMRLYYDLLAKVSGIKLRSYQDWCVPVHWMMTITLDQEYNRDDFIDYMSENEIDCRQMINPVHHAEHFVNSYNFDEFPNSVSISKQSVHLPSSTGLREEEIEFIANKVISFLK